MSGFVSGLPARAVPESDHPGMRMLAHIRALAADEADQLTPRTVDRFDGVERMAAEPEAIAQQEVYRAIVRLCDGIQADIDLLPRVVALLAREVRR